jgi:hypothetical protein
MLSRCETEALGAVHLKETALLDPQVAQDRLQEERNTWKILVGFLIGYTKNPH